MEAKTLCLGLIFALGAFGIKNGAGLFYVLKSQRSFNLKASVLILFVTVYYGIFETCFSIISRTDLLRYLDYFQKFLRYAMLIHILMAGGLVSWGVLLLKRSKKSTYSTKAWLAMVIPCPVCLFVIFLTTSFIMYSFPEAAHRSVLDGYVVFIVMALLTSIFMSVGSLEDPVNSTKKLGLAMISVALYFMLSILIMPHFHDMAQIYRLAEYRSTAGALNPKQWTVLESIFTTAFLCGFFYTRITSRKVN